jgi:hypothetical protein
MMCFGLASIEHLLIWIVVVVAVFAIIRVLLALATPADFAWAITAAIQVVRIVLWAAIIIAVIVVVFAPLACLVPLPIR